MLKILKDEEGKIGESKKRGWAKWILIVGLLLSLKLIFGISNKSNNETNRESQLQSLLAESRANKEFVKTELKKYEACFNDNELEYDVGIAKECISGVTSLIYKFEGESDIVARADEYFQNNSKYLSNEDRQIAENSLKIYKSKEYKGLVESKISHLQAILAYYKFINDRTQFGKLADLSDSNAQKFLAITKLIEQSFTKSQSAENSLNNFLKANFDQKFIDLLISQNNL